MVRSDLDFSELEGKLVDTGAYDTGLQHGKLVGEEFGFYVGVISQFEEVLQASCTNVENQNSYSCTLIPGSLIDCLTNSGYEFQCLFASQHTPGQATFFCDAQTEEMLYQEAQSGAAFQDVLKNAL